MARQFYWSVRRELWEYRSIYVAPIAVAALIVVGFLINAIRLPARMGSASAPDPARQHELFTQPFHLAMFVIMGITFVIAIFYCLDALHAERRDRSILFWKSLPISDLTVVLAKASIPILVIPLLSFLLTVLVHVVMLAVGSAVMRSFDLSIAEFWEHVSPFHLWGMLLTHLVTIHIFWYAPIYGWLLFVSAWARRLPFLWAFLPLAAVLLIEKIAFNTSHLLAVLQYRMSGPEAVPFTSGNMSLYSMAHLSLRGFLGNPGLWTGLVAAIVFLFAVARLRRTRSPI
jgi:ABC-2 type transport system permease protein